MTRLLSAIALALLTGALSFGQYMNDGSSTYADTWGDQAYGVLGYGSISHGLSIHEYAIDVTITSPKGRKASATGSYGQLGASASNEAALPWDLTDLGLYDISIQPRGWCSIAKIGFTFVLSLITGLIAQPFVTYYTAAQMVAGQCYWSTLACLPGTTPTCPDGTNYYPYQTCPYFVSARFFKYTVGVVSQCFTYIAKPKVETGPGKCT